MEIVLAVNIICPNCDYNYLMVPDERQMIKDGTKLECPKCKVIQKITFKIKD